MDLVNYVDKKTHEAKQNFVGNNTNKSKTGLFGYKKSAAIIMGKREVYFPEFRQEPYESFLFTILFLLVLYGQRCLSGIAYEQEGY